MKNRRYDNQRRPTRIERVERKCDRILSELLIIKQRLSKRPDGLDTAIDRMHDAARKMRAQCEKERDLARSMFITQHNER